MIFVTVGTTSFDNLIEEIDKLSLNEAWDDKVICQIGNGHYIPKNCDSFKFKPSIDQLIQDADLVITHGGTTVMNLLLEGKSFVAIANTDLADNHQYKMLHKIASSRDLLWTDDLSQLSHLIAEARAVKKNKCSKSNLNSLVKDIRTYVGCS